MSPENTDGNDDKAPKSGMLSKLFQGARTYAAEYIGVAAQEMRLLSTVFSKASHLIGLKDADGAAITALCDHASKGLAALSKEIRGGFEIEQLPQAAQFLPRLLRNAGHHLQNINEFLSPEVLERALEHAETIAGHVRTLKPDLKIPKFTPGMAG